jgi:hypothetical protein
MPPSVPCYHGEVLGKRGVAALAVLLALHAFFVLRTHGNFDHDHDSQHYARLAHDMTLGEFELAPHAFNNRLGVTSRRRSATSCSASTATPRRCGPSSRRWPPSRSQARSPVGWAGPARDWWRRSCSP